MKQKQVFWHIFFAILLLLVSIFMITAFYMTGVMKSFYYMEIKGDLLARAQLVEVTVQRLASADDLESLRRFCRQAGRRAATRITVIDKNGQVLADSDEDPELMESHNTRPEFVEAVGGSPGSAVRYSRTLHQDMMYVAIPLKGDNGGEEAAALRLAIPLTVVRNALGNLKMKAVLAGMMILSAAIFGAMFLSSRLSRPLVRMKKYAEQIAAGNPAELPISDSSWLVSEEIHSLAMAMNSMGLNIRQRLNTIDRQKNELEMVFCALKEAVIVLDNDKHIIRLNRAAAELFAVEWDKALGRPLSGISRDVELNGKLAEVDKREEPAEIEFSCQTHNGERCLHARFALLRSADGTRAGILIVISDLTEIRRLENIRKEFVANVSHELKTPITSIRGYGEILLEGAVDNEDERHKFMATIVRQTRRLQAIVEDLLALSRIEQEAGLGNIKLEPASLADILASVKDMCAIKAGEKNIAIDIALDRDFRIMANPALLGQALTNLVINGIKYSEKEGRVEISAAMQECGRKCAAREELVISVRDNGVGIAAEHLPRIFERFYRIDKARSRKLGGTGLGLAIVKHIARVHGGRASVESAPGKGSVFSIHLPSKSCLKGA